MHTHRFSSLAGFLLLGSLTALALTACGPSNAEPTVGPEAIFTSAFETFSANMATQQAAATPTFTAQPLPSPSPFPTFAPIATLPITSFSTPAVGAPPAGTAGCKNDSTWVTDVTVPDGTILTPGEDFKKTWRVQNIGTCTWNTKYSVKFKDGSKMAGSDGSVLISVPPGQQVELTVNLEAPQDVGDFYGRWVMYDADGKAFGSILTVVLKVRGEAQ